MGEAQVQVVEDVCASRLTAEQVCLSAGGFATLDLAVPADFSRPGARPQVMLSSDASIAAFTVAAVLPSCDTGVAQVALGDPDRLFRGGMPSATVRATTDLFADQQLTETVTAAGDIAVIAPHGGAIERRTAEQVALVSADERLQLDTWVCVGRGLNQNPRLHITSDDISEQSFPGFRDLLEREHSMAVSFHGFTSVTNPYTGAALDVIVGGQFDLDGRDEIADRIRHRLPADPEYRVFVTTSCRDPFSGLSPGNVVNRLSDAGGVQIEQSQRLRQSVKATRLVAQAIVEALLAQNDHG